MFQFAKLLARRLLRSFASPAAQPPQATPTIIDSAELLRTLSIDDIEITSLRARSEGLTLSDGKQLEIEHTGLGIAGGSGTLIKADDHEFTVCALCAHEANRFARRGRILPAQAKLHSLCRTDLIKYSTSSGEALCPLHYRIIPTETGEVVLSTTELEDQQLRAPINAVSALFVKRNP